MVTPTTMQPKWLCKAAVSLLTGMVSFQANFPSFVEIFVARNAGIETYLQPSTLISQGADIIIEELVVTEGSTTIVISACSKIKS